MVLFCGVAKDGCSMQMTPLKILVNVNLYLRLIKNLNMTYGAMEV
jgi:hypothetical protein